jgi:hypothetical protein
MTTIVSDRRDVPGCGGDGPRRSAAIPGRTRHGEGRFGCQPFQVPRRMEVMVMALATLRTHSFSIASRQRLVLPATHGAPLAPWIPVISNNQPRSVAFRLVFHLRAHHPNAHVSNGASELLVREHPFDVSILDHERLVFAAEPGRELMRNVRSEIGKAGMQPCQCRSGRSPVVRDRQARSVGQTGMASKPRHLVGGFQRAAETPTANREAIQRCVEWLGRFDDFAAGDRCGSRNAQVDAIDLMGGATPIALRIGHFDRYGHTPTICGARDYCPQHRAREAPFLGHGDVADLVLGRRIVVPIRGNVSLATSTRSWRWPFFWERGACASLPALAVGEESFPGFGEMGKRLGVCVPVHVLQPRPSVFVEPLWVGVCDGVELLVERYGVRRAACCVLFVPFIERPVPDALGRAAGALDVIHLLGSRATSDRGGSLHGWTGLAPCASCFSASFNVFRSFLTPYR